MSSAEEIAATPLSDLVPDVKPQSNNKTSSHPEQPSLNEKTSLPSLENKPLTHQLKSHSLLFGVVIAAVLASYLFGFSLLQVHPSSTWLELGVFLACIAGAAGIALAWTGTHSLDVWELVMRWGWYTLPGLGAAGLIFVMMQERSDGMDDVS